MMKLIICSALCLAAAITVVNSTSAPTYMSGKFLKEQCEFGASLYLAGYSEKDIRAQLEKNMLIAFSPLIRNICDRKKRSLERGSSCNSVFTYVWTAVHTAVDTVGSLLLSQSGIFEIGGGANLEAGGISITIDLDADLINRIKSSHSPKEIQFIESTCKIFDTFEGVYFDDSSSLDALKNLINTHIE